MSHPIFLKREVKDLSFQYIRKEIHIQEINKKTEKEEEAQKKKTKKGRKRRHEKNKARQLQVYSHLLNLTKTPNHPIQPSKLATN